MSNLNFLSVFPDPDLLSGDGIYSRYLGNQARFSGRYLLTFDIDDNNETSVYIVPRPEPSLPSRNRQQKNYRTEGRLSRHFSDDERQQQQQQQQQQKQDEDDDNDEEDEDVDDVKDDLRYVDLMVTSSIKKCCGSTMKISGIREKTGIFRRKSVGPVVYIQKPETEDRHPPSRIGDFKIIQIAGTTDKLLATWLAPGGDFTVGSVASYR